MSSVILRRKFTPVARSHRTQELDEVCAVEPVESAVSQARDLAFDPCMLVCLIEVGCSRKLNRISHQRAFSARWP
jgi:hypothetical protein